MNTLAGWILKAYPTVETAAIFASEMMAFFTVR